MGFIDVLKSAFGKNNKNDSLIGESGIVINDINGTDAGLIRVAGEKLTAIAADGIEIPKSAKVVVRKVNTDNLVVDVVRF